MSSAKRFLSHGPGREQTHKTEAWLFHVRWMRRALQETGKDARGMYGKEVGKEVYGVEDGRMGPRI